MKIFALLLFVGVAATANAAEVNWRKWDQKELFAIAQREHKFVLLDLQAVWCHWCHVMEQTTYRDPAVQKLLAQKYVTVKVDQDGDPELAARYEDYGWPATIVLAADGSEIVRRRGYIKPGEMKALLEAIIEDPTPGPSVTSAQAANAAPGAARLSAEQREALRKDFFAVYDAKHGGWGNAHKYLPADAIELAFALFKSGDAARARKMAKQTLDAALNLIDPVWGGVYQYSDQVNWKSPHFEKIVAYQADYLRQYAHAYEYFHDAKYLAAARAIDRYVDAFLLSPDGAVYVSQDADLNDSVDGHAYYALSDARRRALGIPHVDDHLYAREIGWMIPAWLKLYEVTHDEALLAKSRRAADWAIAHRGRQAGGFAHEQVDGPFYLADNAAMALALATLARITNEPQYTARAADTLRFIDRTFKDERGGYATSPADAKAGGVFATRSRTVDENIAVARAALAVGQVTHDIAAYDAVRHTMKYLSAPDIASRPFSPGILLVDVDLPQK